MKGNYNNSMGNNGKKANYTYFYHNSMVMSNLKIFSLERAVSIKYVHKVLTTRCLCAKIMNNGFCGHGGTGRRARLRI